MSLEYLVIPGSKEAVKTSRVLSKDFGYQFKEDPTGQWDNLSISRTINAMDGLKHIKYI